MKRMIVTDYMLVATGNMNRFDSHRQSQDQQKYC